MFLLSLLLNVLAVSAVVVIAVFVFVRLPHLQLGATDGEIWVSCTGNSELSKVLSLQMVGGSFFLACEDFRRISTICSPPALLIFFFSGD